MKWIYTALITLVIISMFSLAATAQETKVSPNGIASTTSSDVPKGVENAADNARLDVSKNLLSKKTARKPVALERAAKPRMAHSPDEQQTDQMFGVPGYKNGEVDRYGYQGTPLSTKSRPCLVSGARRCVQ